MLFDLFALCFSIFVFGYVMFNTIYWNKRQEKKKWERIRAYKGGGREPRMAHILKRIRSDE